MDESLWPKGLKKTKQRAVVLGELYGAGKPVSARDIYSLLERRGDSMWLSTIYRVLDALLECGIIRKAAVYEGGMALYELNDGHRHYAVCDGCRRIVALRSCPLEGLTPELQDKKFHVSGHKLQISGYCEECYAKSRP